MFHLNFLTINLPSWQTVLVFSTGFAPQNAIYLDVMPYASPSAARIIFNTDGGVYFDPLDNSGELSVKCMIIFIR